MSISTYAIQTGKSLTFNWSTAYTIYGRDFNPRQSDIPDPPSDWDSNTIRASWETSFNLSWFQYGNEVCFCVATFHFSGENLRNTDIDITMVFQKYSGGWQNAWWVYYDTVKFNSASWMQWKWRYVWIDSDEIWDDATQYRFLVQVSGWWEYEEFTAPFTISNLSFDTTRHPSWYLWVEWQNLCYTDASYSSTRWYKHKINYDGAYSWGSGSPWYIWLPTSSTDDHIYYTDANWYVRRTKSSQPRFDEGDDYAWSGNAWYLWVSDGYWAEDWYAHLCYVNNQWYKRRIINWWVS